MASQNRAARATTANTARAEAAAWIAKLHGPNRTSELDAGLHRWLAESDENRRTFERMTEAWDDATAMASRVYPRVRATRSPKFWKRPVAAALVASCMVAALGAYWLSGNETYTTEVGEQRTVLLGDGSRVSLNSGSRLVVHYRASRRWLRLERGEALFEVASSHTRPFVVAAGDHDVIALGTTFSVRYEPQRLAIVLLEGKIVVEHPALSPDSNSGDTNITLAPGERLTLAEFHAPQLDRPRMEAVTAWRRGEVVLEKTTLAAAITEMNRYDRSQLRIDDARVATLEVSGIYRGGDNAGFAYAIARMHHLSVVKDKGEIHLRR